ncbi:transmembrane protein 229A-like isoform X2 [Mya arenaria]|nr:transmembrane protein 229A-like isoform X2 [Mya arenaria]
MPTKAKESGAVSRPLPAWLRFYLYGMHGLLDEIVFTALFDFFFEPEGNAMLKGYSTLFSFLIYGSCSFVVERVYVYLYLRHGVQWYIRWPLYLCILYTWEFTFGLVLRQFDACSWDYSHYPLNVMGLITLVYAPAWLVLVVYQDVLAHFLLSLKVTTDVHMEGLLHKVD